ncbi:hypothetical protein YYG_00006 [Plasmodium vinckei petteri]|uniref:CIR protein PIR protein n=1 Tax=Plasmodium vinckei petteri TaxID=138298 RepID=W7AZK2_PLAVN|nr:hypothetical protein YYG_00006 [Plasmodium vinckei petteri]CAD2112630.1 CIR protein PIR protein, fragment [Plasmodium vinckei petteri]
MYNDINKDTADWPQFSQKAKTFGDEYSKLLNNNDFDTDDSSHRTLLSSLSTDYDNFKKYCNKKCTGRSIPSRPTTKTTQVSAHISDDTSSSSSIPSKLIPPLLIFAIPIFLGIAYKINNKELINMIFKNYFRDSLYTIIKKCIYVCHFYISIHYLDLINDFKDNI